MHKRNLQLAWRLGHSLRPYHFQRAGCFVMAYPKNKTAANALDITNQKFGRWTARLRIKQPNGRTKWRCECICGKIKDIDLASLRCGLSQSCGCLLKEELRSRATHGAWVGKIESGAHRSWKNMMARCYEPKNISFKRYGLKGVRVCEQWHLFENFLKDMGARPLGHTLERIQNSEGYSKANCCWATQKTQQNNRTNNNRVTIDGETLTVAQWAERTTVKAGTIYARLAQGKMSAKAAVFFPVT